MVVVSNRSGETKSLIAAGNFSTEADTTPPAGKGAGFRPHELLESALASCAAITLRMVADARGFELESIRVSVEVDRSNPEEAVFKIDLDLHGNLSTSERELLVAAARNCPVRRTLLRRLSFAEPN